MLLCRTSHLELLILLPGFASPGSLLLLKSHAQSDFVAPPLDCAKAESPLPSRAVCNLDLLMFLVGLFCSDLLLSALDLLALEASLSSKTLARTGLFLLLIGAARPGPSNQCLGAGTSRPSTSD